MGNSRKRGGGGFEGGIIDFSNVGSQELLESSLTLIGNKNWFFRCSTRLDIDFNGRFEKRGEGGFEAGIVDFLNSGKSGTAAELVNFIKNRVLRELG
ncbi:unnamed protein product [Caenorhabditis angaria]|uniref:Uncharacterized protein n=1 Tax=Caenorhabditis angaria TaxID=860376 RepID=A0A9P1IUH9_9PELO|nr:unnamed protein product [Caenorhabditis angaria]